MPLTTKELYWYWLAANPGVGIGSIFAAANKGYSLEQLFYETELLEDKAFPFTAAAKEILKKRAKVSLLLEEIDAIEKKGIRICTAISPEYPAMLKDLWRPPAVLFIAGNLKTFSPKSIAMVGSRRVSRKGAAAAKELAFQLASEDVTIVSGMARGIDTQSHWGAIEANGKTVAVLGCGVDIIYPQENAELYARICEKGAVISEYAPGTQPLVSNFPLRNRIIAGLSQGTVLGEAGLRSGANITVNYACDHNRDVFVLHRGEGDGNFETVHKLLDMGAFEVTNGQEILDYYGWNGTNTVQKERKQPAEKPAGLDFFQEGIYNLLLKGDFSMQQMIDILQQPASAVSTALTMLELRGIVERLPGNQFGLKL